MEGEKKVSERQLEAKKYLEEYDIENVVGEMLNSLLHERAEHPYVYMIKYLASLMTEEERKEFNLSIPEPYPIAHPVVKYPKFNDNNNSFLKQNLSKEKFNSLKKIKTKHGNNINSVTKLTDALPDDPIGAILSDGDCINVYKDFLNGVIKSAHNISSDVINDYPLHVFPTLSIGDCYGIDELKGNLNRLIYSYSRNIIDYPFNHFSCGIDKLAAINNMIVKEIKSKSSEELFKSLKLLTYKENKEEIEELLKLVNYDLEWLQLSGLTQRWPEHRTVFVNEDKSIVILINFSNHLEIFSIYSNENMDPVNTFNNLVEVLKQLSLTLTFETNKTYGYLTSEINLLGAGFKISSEITLNQALSIKLEGCELEDLVKGLKFDKYSLNKNESEDKVNIIAVESCKLLEPNEISFISKFLTKMAGLNKVFNSEKKNELNLSFSHIDLPSFTNPKLALIKEIYDNLFEDIKYSLSARGTNINSIISPLAKKAADTTDNLGLILSDKSEYLAFVAFIKEYLLKMQKFNITTTDHIHKLEESKEMVEVPETGLECISSLNVCIFRNIDGIPFGLNTNTDKENIEKIISEKIEEINTKGHFADYISKTSNKENYNSLIENNSLSIYDTKEDDSFKGVIKFEKENIYGVVNDIDHIKFYLHLNEPKEKLGSPLVAVLKELNEMAKHIKFSYDNRLGFITSSPFYLGTGIQLFLKLKLKNLESDDVAKMMEEKEFEIIEEKKEGDKLELTITNKITIGESETELFTNLLKLTKEIVEEELI